MPKLLGVLGPLVAAIGAAILIVDALRGPVRWMNSSIGLVERPIVKMEGFFILYPVYACLVVAFK